MAATAPTDMHSYIRAISCHLPETKLANDALAALFPAWPAAKIEAKTGIRTRHIAAPDETASDLAVKAGLRLFAENSIAPGEIDYLLYCTQSPDQPLPTTACSIHRRLGLPTSCGALDFNLGCSGFVYGLGLAHGLIGSGQAHNVLLITADTYTKYLHPEDHGTRTIFGDGAAATLVSRSEQPGIGPFLYGTDGDGHGNLIVESGGARAATVGFTSASPKPCYLHMNGPEIFNFTLSAVPTAVNEILATAKLTLDDIDLVVFHQANQFMLEHLRNKIGIAKERFVITMADTGNTVSATIPLALRAVVDDKRLTPGKTALLVGFGVGYSWAGAVVRWRQP